MYDNKVFFVLYAGNIYTLHQINLLHIVVLKQRSQKEKTQQKHVISRKSLMIKGLDKKCFLLIFILNLLCCTLFELFTFSNSQFLFCEYI